MYFFERSSKQIVPWNKKSSDFRTAKHPTVSETTQPNIEKNRHRYRRHYRNKRTQPSDIKSGKRAKVVLGVPAIKIRTPTGRKSDGARENCSDNLISLGFPRRLYCAENKEVH